MSKRKVTTKSLRQGQTVYLVVCEIGEPDQPYNVYKIQLKSYKTPFPAPFETAIDKNHRTNIDHMKMRISRYEKYGIMRLDIFYSRRKAESRAKLRNSIERGIIK